MTASQGLEILRGLRWAKSRVAMSGSKMEMVGIGKKDMSVGPSVAHTLWGIRGVVL